MPNPPDSFITSDSLGAQGEAEWQRLREQVDLASGFWLAFIFVSAAATANVLFRRLEAHLRLHGYGIERFHPSEPSELPLALQALQLPDRSNERGLWIEAVHADAPASSDESSPWALAWDALMLRTNEQRDALRRNLKAPLLFVTHATIKPRIREAAPDLWSVRSIVVEIAPTPAASPLPPMDHAELDRPEIVVPSPDPERALEEAQRRLERGGDPRSALAAFMRAASGFLDHARAVDALEPARAAVAIAEGLPPGGHLDVVAALQTLARAEDESGDPVSALDHLRQAQAIAEQRESGDERLMFILGDYSRIAFRVGDLSTALQYAERALTLARPMATQSDSNTVTNLVRVLLLIGDVHRDRGEFARAQSFYEEALSSVQRLAAADDEYWQQYLSVVLSRLSDAQRSQGDAASALRGYEAALKIDERLADQDPGNFTRLFNLAISWYALGRVRQAEGDLEGAQQAFERNLTIAQQLVADHPDHDGVQRQLALGWTSLGRIRANQGLPEEALTAFQNACDIDERRVAADPTHFNASLDLATHLCELGDVYLRLGNPTIAAAHFRRSLTLANKLAERAPEDYYVQSLLTAARERVSLVQSQQPPPAELRPEKS